jgi:hypothetical protein
LGTFGGKSGISGFYSLLDHRLGKEAEKYHPSKFEVKRTHIKIGN